MDRGELFPSLLALKKIQLDEKRKTRTRTAVEREAKILSQLKHPHIVTYHDSFFEEKPEVVFLCIAQDYCDGGNLDERIQTAKLRSEHFSEDRVMQWFIQLAMAVQFIHSKKILHRDLKTQNVFLTKKDVIKLGDFGISRTLEHTVDQAKTCVGTPCYLSPELCQDQPYNNKSDVWALGCLLYELCAFEPAFDAHNLLSLYFKIVKGDNPTLPSMYSGDLQGLLAAILVKDPDKRPSATTILGHSYMQQHLGHFIAEKELLQKQLEASPTKPKPSSSPVIGSKVIDLPTTTRNRPVSASHARQRTPHRPTHSERLPPRSQSALGMLPSSPLRIPGNSVLPPIPQRRPPLEPSESGEYPDDFDSSDEERENPMEQRGVESRDMRSAVRPQSVNSRKDVDGDLDGEVPEECDVASNSDEDIPEELVAEEDVEEAIDRRTERKEEDEEGEYLSDFEDDDEEENLQNILTNARTAANVEMDNDHDDSFEDSVNLSDSLANCRHLVAEECRDVLGDGVFQEIEAKIKENRGKGLDPYQLRLQFEEAIGSERMDTCYLLTELLADLDSMNVTEKGVQPVS
ncbi:uncharacterized protein [Diadema antillarum]|uniref:uncharacterized protein n=1 Tax=Diadema antillarum TaxID=105358 RepID=UPI003A85407C